MKIEFILNESKLKDILLKYKDRLEEPYKKGLLNDIKPIFIEWIAKQKEPVEDIIDLVKSFERNIQRLEKKDINQYSSNELRRILNDLGNSKTKEKETTKSEITDLGTFGDWRVIMPHSREASCLFGKDTTWCTAATNSQNLFYSYVARKNENIILFYIINSKENSRINPDAKLSIGFINGKPVYNGYGGVSVNADQKALNEKILEQILGKNYSPIMNKMKEITDSMEGKHPAKLKFEILSQNTQKALEYVNQFSDFESKEDAIKNILSYNPPKEFIFAILTTYERAFYITQKINLYLIKCGLKTIK